MTEKSQQLADECEDLHAQRVEKVRAMLSARKTWRQHLGDTLGRVCPGQVHPDCQHRREGKLSQSEIDRMVQEAENYRDEDEANESKDEAESGLENSRRSSNAVTDTWFAF